MSLYHYRMYKSEFFLNYRVECLHCELYFSAALMFAQAILRLLVEIFDRHDSGKAANETLINLVIFFKILLQIMNIPLQKLIFNFVKNVFLNRNKPQHNLKQENHVWEDLTLITSFDVTKQLSPFIINRSINHRITKRRINI